MTWGMNVFCSLPYFREVRRSSNVSILNKNSERRVSSRTGSRTNVRSRP